MMCQKRTVRRMPTMNDTEERRPEINIVIGPPRADNEIGLVPPLAVMVSRAQRAAWGLETPLPRRYER